MISIHLPLFNYTVNIDDDAIPSVFSTGMNFGPELERVNSMKNIGVILDYQLNFDDHVNLVHGKAVKKLGILRKSRKFLDRKTSLTLYWSLVLPHLDYCNLIYECTSKANLNKLQQIQTSVRRTMLN